MSSGVRSRWSVSMSNETKPRHGPNAVALEPAAPWVDAGERALVLTASLLAVAICIPAVGALHFLWDDLAYYGHGYALPVAAAYLAYGNRRGIALALKSLHPPRFGFAVVFAAAVFEVLAFVADIGSASGLGIALVFGATAYAVGGMPLLRPLLLSLAFLTLMIPPPQFILYQLLFRLKLFVTQVSVTLLQAGGHSVLAEGNVLVVPGHSLFVADACTGLTSIVTMLPLACIVAYFLSRGVWRRAAVVLSVIPVAIGANIIRVVLTVWMVPTWGAEAAQGVLHESFGLVTYTVGILSVLAVARIVR
jgi:exosortase